MEQINNTTANETGTNSPQPTLQDIEKKYFSIDALEEGLGYVNSVIGIAENEAVEAVFNFDPSEDLPEGYGLAVIPQTKRVPERGNQTIGVTIAAIPDFDTVMDDDAGKSWIIKQVQNLLMKQVDIAAKPKDEGALVSIPFKLSEFITSTRSSGLVAFNLVASLFVSALKKKGLKFMTKVLLRQVLASAAFAEQQFPRIDQENWQIVLNSMIAHAKKENIDAGVLKHWLDTRDQTEIDSTAYDLSDIDDMVDGKDKSESAEPATTQS